MECNESDSHQSTDQAWHKESISFDVCIIIVLALLLVPSVRRLCVNMAQQRPMHSNRHRQHGKAKC